MELGEKGVVKPDIVGITDDLFYDHPQPRLCAQRFGLD